MTLKTRANQGPNALHQSQPTLPRCMFNSCPTQKSINYQHINVISFSVSLFLQFLLSGTPFLFDLAKGRKHPFTRYILGTYFVPDTQAVPVTRHLLKPDGVWIKSGSSRSTLRQDPGLALNGLCDLARAAYAFCALLYSL